MSDKHSTHDPVIHRRVTDLEKKVNVVQRLMETNGKQVSDQLAEIRTMMLKQSKNIDRIYVVAVDSATKVNLMQRQNIHAQETCHPMIIIQDHLKDHEKADKERKDQQDRIEKRGLSRWQKAAVTIGATTGIGSLVFTVVKSLLGKQ